MTALCLEQVAKITGARVMRGDVLTPLAGVSTDTRSIDPGALYVALSGARHDGNHFAEQASARGAGALLLRGNGEQPELPDGETPVLLVPDPLRALGDLASWHRQRLNASVVGITGSCGKTTVKELALQLLSPHRRVVASPRSFNNAIGVPLTLLAADERTEVLLCEIGTNQPGEIAALTRIARPFAGVVTNIGAAHLAGLGSLDGVAREKSALVAGIPSQGFVVLNADCSFLGTLQEASSARVVSFSVEGEGDLDARDVWFHPAGTTFRLGELEVTSPLLGLHNVQNLLAALALCTGLGVELQALLPGVAGLRGARQRMEKSEHDGVTIIDDTWNANPDSARAAVRVLEGLHGHARRALVLGDMMELGELAAELHHEIGLEAARAELDLFVCVGELAKAAAAGALEGGLAPDRVLHLESTESAAREVPGLLKDGDVVLIKGSRGMALEHLVESVRLSRGKRGA